MKQLQRDILQNKIDCRFNTTNVECEFCLVHGEMAEAYQAYLKHKPDLGEKLADVAVYLLGISEILGIDLEQEILRKMEKNRKHVYIKVDGEYVKIEE